MEEKDLIGQDVCVYDIETKTFGKPDATKDVLRFFGCYSYKTKKFYLLTDREQVQKVINAHRFLVGFNNKEYDNPILLRSGIDLNYKVIIDLREVFKKRCNIIKIKEGIIGDLLMEYSLKFIAKTIHLVSDEDNKKEIDYQIFNKDKWTTEELKEIYDYTRRDIEVTKKMYDWIEDYFSSFKDYLNEKDKGRKIYITSSPATFTYKAICHEMGWSDEMAHEEMNAEHDRISGGYVAYPAGEFFENDMAMYDFSSLYPNIFIQCNLFSHSCDCCKQDEKWNGKGFFNITGYYCTKKHGKIEELYKKLYLLRREYIKSGDHKAYALKIILNTGYGITDNPVFIKMYNKIGAGDCTAIGRQCILYTRKRFKEEGYINIMSDTDSICVKIPEGKTVEDSNRLAKKIVEELQQFMPFPW